MLDKFKFLLFFILIIVLFVLIFLVNWDKDMYAFYHEKKIELHLDGKKEVSESKYLFMERIIKAAQYGNYLIVEDQKLIMKARKSFHKTSAISKFQLLKLQKLVDNYGLEKKLEELETAEIASLFDDLRKRVEIVPVRLTLAQAIMESAWGESRFAREGNAFFGIHCYEDGCGMQIGDQKEYIKSYPNLQASVNDYMLFLNSKPGTEKFRNTRQLYLTDHDMNALVESLDNYSEEQDHYFNIINDLLKNYLPDHIDDY